MFLELAIILSNFYCEEISLYGGTLVCVHEMNDNLYGNYFTGLPILFVNSKYPNLREKVIRHEYCHHLVFLKGMKFDSEQSEHEYCMVGINATKEEKAKYNE